MSTQPASPVVDSPFLEADSLAANGPLDAEQIRAFAEQGYLVLEDLFEESFLDSIVDQTSPLFDDSVPDGPRSRIRVQDVWSEAPAVRELATHPRVLDVLRQLYGREPVPFQTLNFQYGTEQHAHADRMFFSTLPSDFMCGVWVALEDVSLANGTLFYHPGSQRLPEPTPDGLGVPAVHLARDGAPDQNRGRAALEQHLERLLEEGGFEVEHLEAPKGTVLIWAAGIAHGGSPIGEPGRTRHSQVTHYFFEDCLYYTPMYSNHYAGDLYLRQVTDIRTGSELQHAYSGLPVRGIDGNGFYKLELRVEDSGEAYAQAVDTTDTRDHKKILEQVLASPSFRIGRMLTAPLRWLRSRAR